MVAVAVCCLPAEMVWNGVALQLAACRCGVLWCGVGAFTCQVLYLLGATIKAPRAKVLVQSTWRRGGGKSGFIDYIYISESLYERS